MTTLLAAARADDQRALDQLFSELYSELRQLAHIRLRHHQAPTLLDTTSLVHESYLRFLKAGQVQISDRAHFLAYAARVMRSVVVDFARESAAHRRGGQDVHVLLDADAAPAATTGESEVLRVNDALEELASVSERLVRVVEMRYFGGMNEGEVAEALGLTDRTVRRIGKRQRSSWRLH